MASIASGFELCTYVFYRVSGVEHVQICRLGVRGECSRCSWKFRNCTSRRLGYVSNLAGKSGPYQRNCVYRELPIEKFVSFVYFRNILVTLTPKLHFSLFKGSNRLYCRIGMVSATRNEDIFADFTI
jgi:hypothetical protein